MEDIIQTITYPQEIWSRADVLSSPCPVPKKSGIYAWYFKEAPPRVPVYGCHKYQGLTLLYLGISPSRENSKRNLAKRIKEHYRANAYGSTLRRSLGCLLSETLDIHLQQIGDSGKRIHFGEGESVLSTWMAKNAFVTWVMQEEPWIFEDKIINQLNLPLNLQGNRSHPFHSTLSRIRKECKDAAG